jgi:hypothetical protein
MLYQVLCEAGKRDYMEIVNTDFTISSEFLVLPVIRLCAG